MVHFYRSKTEVGELILAVMKVGTVPILFAVVFLVPNTLPDI